MDTITLALLQYNYTDKFNVILYSTKSTYLQDALNYLASVKVIFVKSIPEKAFGYFCVLEEEVFKVYNCYMDAESEITIQEYIYSLKYIDMELKQIVNKQLVSEILVQ